MTHAEAEAKAREIHGDNWTAMNADQRIAAVQQITRETLVASAKAKLTVAEYAAVADHMITSFLEDVHQATDEEMIALVVLAGAVPSDPIRACGQPVGRCPHAPVCPKI